MNKEIWRRCLRRSFHLSKKVSSSACRPLSVTPGGLSNHRKSILRLPIVDNVLLNTISIGSKLLTLFTTTHTITTQVSAEQENVIKALEFFINAKKDEAISIEELCAVYLEKLCRSGNMADAVCLLGQLHTRDINLYLSTYNVLLKAAVESNNFNHFSEVFKNLLISGLPPDITSYDKVAEAFEKVVGSDLACDFIKDVSEMCTDCTVINRIIFVTAKHGQTDKSLMIFEALKNLNLKMDTITFNTVLAILGKASRINKMMSEFMVMKEFGYIPDLITYSTVINCLRRHGRLDLCKTIAIEMFDKGIQMDLLTYTALIDVFGRAGHVEDALRIFEEMKKFQHPSVYTYRSLINNLKKAGKLELALRLSSEMNSSTTKLAGPEDFKHRRKKFKKVG